jgi:hypothetical protein
VATLTPKIEIATDGTQKNRILRDLRPSPLAAKNKAKNRMAESQNIGDKRVSTNPPATAIKPVAFSALAYLNVSTTSCAKTAVKIAAMILSTTRVYFILPPDLESIVTRYRDSTEQ